MRQRLPALCAALIALLLAACASPGTPEERAQRTVVERTSSTTTWTTEEAIAAAAAEAARQAANRGAASRQAPRPAAAAATTAPAPEKAPPAPVAAAPEVGHIVYFEFDRADILDGFRPLIEAHAEAMKADASAQWVIEGHADERGGAEYNLALGQRRSEAVLMALGLLGVSESRLEAVSFGKGRPAVEGHDEEAWAKNRRAEIKRKR